MASFALSFQSKRDDESGLSAFYNNKTTIIQEARVFNESPLSPRKCRALLTRIIYLLYVGETFGTQEATELFFGTTKLFQHKDVSARLSTGSMFLMDFPRVLFDKQSTWLSRNSQLRLRMS